MFNDMLKTQLILKNIVTPEDWNKMVDHIQYDFLYDNQFAELKETEMIQGRLGNLAQIEPYIGKYYSCLLYTSPSPRDGLLSRMPSSA